MDLYLLAKCQNQISKTRVLPSPMFRLCALVCSCGALGPLASAAVSSAHQQSRAVTSRRALAAATPAISVLAARCARAAPAPAVAGPAVDSALRRRVRRRIILKPEPVVEARDLYYPAEFEGLFSARSTTLSVDAPLGPERVRAASTKNPGRCRRRRRRRLHFLIACV